MKSGKVLHFSLVSYSLQPPNPRRRVWGSVRIRRFSKGVWSALRGRARPSGENPPAPFPRVRRFPPNVLGLGRVLSQLTVDRLHRDLSRRLQETVWGPCTLNMPQFSRGQKRGGSFQKSTTLGAPFQFQKPARECATFGGERSCDDFFCFLCFAFV